MMEEMYLESELHLAFRSTRSPGKGYELKALFPKISEIEDSSQPYFGVCLFLQIWKT